MKFTLPQLYRATPTEAEDGGEPVYFYKGRVALYAILKTLGIGPGDAVIVPGYTCVVVPTAVQFAGATPVFADIDSATYNTSHAHIETAAARAEAAGLTLKAVIVQHTYGIPAPIGPIVRWAAARDAWVIEDCCHAWGSRYREETEWQEVGTFGDAAFFSSQWSKPFTTGLGGWARASGELQRRLVDFAAHECHRPTRRESWTLAAQLAVHRLLFRPKLAWIARDTLRRLSRAGLLVGSSEPGELEIRMAADYTKRMSRLQRQVAIRASRRQAKYVEHARTIRQCYDTALSAAGLPVFTAPEYADPVLLRYPIRVPNPGRLLDQARRERVELGDWFSHPLHPAGLDLAALGWQDDFCPAGCQAAREVVNLPMHRRVGPREVQRTVAFLRRHL